MQTPATMGRARQLRLQPSPVTSTTNQPHRCEVLSVDSRPLVPCNTAHSPGQVKG